MECAFFEVRGQEYGAILGRRGGAAGAPSQVLEKKSPRRFQKKTLSRYDAALARFFDYEPCGVRRIFGDPMALIRFTGTFFSTRFRKWAREIFSGQNVAPLFQTFFPYHGMMPHSLVFSTTSRAALDESLETPWRLFVLRPLFLTLGQKILAARRFVGSHGKTLWLLVVLFFIFFAPLYNIYIYISY
jgi:hypothetical protein